MEAGSFYDEYQTSRNNEHLEKVTQRDAPKERKEEPKAEPASCFQLSAEKSFSS